nr:serine/arginine-rich splicing factor SR45-like [Equus asinus]
MSRRARRAARRRRRWAREGEGRAGAPAARRGEEPRKQPDTQADPESAGGGTSPDSSGGAARERRRVLRPCRPPQSASGAAVRGSGGRARGAKIRPPCRRCAALARTRAAGTRRGRGCGRARPARRPLRPQPRASPRAAARRWPSARRLRAGLLHPTDWRCPAGRLKGAPTSRRPAPPRPARGRARPAPPARPASGGLGGGPRPPPPPPVRRPRAGSSGEQTPPPARPNCARPLLALASGTCRARAAPRPEVCPGAPAARSL